MVKEYCLWHDEELAVPIVIATKSTDQAFVTSNLKFTFSPLKAAPNLDG